MINAQNTVGCDTNWTSVRRASSRRRKQAFAAVVALSLTAVLATVVVISVAALATYRALTDDSGRNYLGADGWPRQGQAAISLGGGARPQASPGQQPAPIASMAKVMTAYLVLRAHPLDSRADGFTLRISEADVRRTETERNQDQSLVSVRAGETLTERQAMLALLLPSANNVAELLARRVAGTVASFVNRMNRTAQSLGMDRTRYVDPSGYASATVSTATDQLRLARAVAGNHAFTQLVATRSARIPVAGIVHNTDTLLGRDGFTGTKTGSHDAAGGCFMFRALRRVDGRTTSVTGVVMGQRGYRLIDAALRAARQLVANRSAARAS